MRYSISISLFVSILFFSFFGFFNKVNAQFSGTPDGDIIVEFVPEVPKDNENVTVIVKSYSVNIDASKFTWRVNNKTIKTGIGEKKFVFTMGDVGQKVTLDLTVDVGNGAVINQTYSFLPTSVDMIWQSSGYVPPFYKGKSLFSHQNTISVIAIPHIPNPNGGEMNKNNMIYKWRKNGSVIESASGYGKNIYTFDSSLISREVDIAVEVTPSEGNGLGYSRIKIKPVEPAILFYKNDSLYGINFQKALVGEENLGNSSEISLFSAPFFFDLSNGQDFLVYKWSINGSAISDVSGSWNQIFRKKEGTSGTSRISLSIENTDRILQYTSSNINLTFEKDEN